MLPGDPSLLSRVGITSTPLVSCVHVTPIRASRALGVRFLSTKFGVSLDRFTLLVIAPTAAAADDDTLLLVRPEGFRFWSPDVVPHPKPGTLIVSTLQ